MSQVISARILCVVAILFLAPLVCLAQRNYASVNGTSFDPQQQVIPGFLCGLCVRGVFCVQYVSRQHLTQSTPRTQRAQRKMQLPQAGAF
jgi:hypothetical protein